MRVLHRICLECGRILPPWPRAGDSTPNGCTGCGSLKIRSIFDIKERPSYFNVWLVVVATLLAVLGLLFSLCGCVTGPISGRKYLSYSEEYFTEVRQHYVNTHQDIDPEIKDAILKAEIMVGMTVEQVKASWGGELMRYSTVAGFGTWEEYRYFGGWRSYWLTFVNGKLHYISHLR